MPKVREITTNCIGEPAANQNLKSQRIQAIWDRETKHERQLSPPRRVLFETNVTLLPQRSRKARAVIHAISNKMGDKL